MAWCGATLVASSLTAGSWSRVTESSEALSEAVGDLLQSLLAALDGLDWAQRRLHPSAVRQLSEQVAPLGPPLGEHLDRLRPMAWPEGLETDGERLLSAAEAVLDSLGAFTKPPAEPWMTGLDPSAVYPLYGALRRRMPALEALYPLCSVLAPISRFFLEVPVRDSVDLLRRLAQATVDDADPPVGIIDHDNARSKRGGFTLYVPEYYSADRQWPLVVALHGGSGHGADSLWTWLREARSRGCLVLAPTSVDRTWSLLEPALDGSRIVEMVDRVKSRWNVDEHRVLLTGMSDGGTFTLVFGFADGLPFTHLAPMSGVMPPLPPEQREAARGKPVYLVHGARDWMFPIATARMARDELTRMGTELVYREIPDLSHTYPREENASVLEWLDPSLCLSARS